MEEIIEKEGGGEDKEIENGETTRKWEREIDDGIELINE